MMEIEKDAYIKDSVVAFHMIVELLNSYNLVLSGADMSDNRIIKSMMENNNLAKLTIGLLMQYKAVQGLPTTVSKPQGELN